MNKKSIAIIGSGGSIGTQTLEVVSETSRFNVIALAVKSNIKTLEAQTRKFNPEIVCVYDEIPAEEFKKNISDLNVKVVSGMDGLIECSTYKKVDTVVMSVVGMIGILPTIEAIKAGKNIALANKETLVTAGHIIMPLVKEYNVTLLPIDSEHSAIFQSLNGENRNTIEKLILTASGGPFRHFTRKDMINIKVEDALKHPNWSMGKKITIDSSTLVNKGLEIMEARWLFDVPADKIEVVVQPQSIIHSAVQFVDGSIIAQMGMPDMKLPIQYSLLYPERIEMKSKRVNFFELGEITFEKPDIENFHGLKLAYDAINTGGSMPTVYNAANEYAVNLFLNRKISYLEITDIINDAMKNHKIILEPTLEEILNTEQETYSFINEQRGNI